MIRWISPLAAVAALWPAALSAQSLTGQEAAQVDQLVNAELAKSGVPSASVAVVRGGKVAFVKAYGRARLGPDKRATVEARYDIGSVSKQFTATLILMLADEGKLSLDDKVGRYLPGVAGADTVSVRQLLNQTTGYQNYWRVDYLPAYMRRDTAPQAIVDRWAHEPLGFAPGTRWQYSNTNYILAGRIVEKVEGRPLAQVLQARIFTPLAMTSARAGAQPPFAAADSAGYSRIALGPPRPADRVPPGWTFGAGGLSMTAWDLARWDMAMLDRRLLKPATYDAQQTETRLADGSGTRYGLGVYVGQVGSHRRIRHDGADDGYLTENRVYPDDRDAIVVTVNADWGGSQYQIAEGLERMLLGDPPPTAAAAAKPAPPSAAKPVDPATTALARRILDDLAAGRLDRRLFTAQGASFFTPQTRADLEATLKRLGPPQKMELKVHSPWNGYPDASIHEITWPGQTLILIIFRTADGRVEEYNLFSRD